MINSKDDYKYFLEQDRIALGKDYKKPKLIHDEIWKFERLLRKTEYYVNCRKDIIGLLYGKYLQYRYYKSRLSHNTYIPLNVFDSGLSIAHFGSIVVNGNSKIGKNCRIQEGVTIGATNGYDNAPIIGNNVFIGTGAKIIGNIEVGNDIAIGANAVVIKNIIEDGTTWGGYLLKKYQTIIHTVI